MWQKVWVLECLLRLWNDLWIFLGFLGDYDMFVDGFWQIIFGIGIGPILSVHYCGMKSEKICWNQFLPHLSLTRKSFIKFLKNLFWLLLRFTQFFLCKGLEFWPTKVCDLMTLLLAKVFFWCCYAVEMLIFTSK